MRGNLSVEVDHLPNHSRVTESRNQDTDGTQGPDGAASQIEKDTGGAAGIQVDTTCRFGTVRPKEAEVLTAKLTGILSDGGNRQRTSGDPGW
jgi:hypothetical protein